MVLRCLQFPPRGRRRSPATYVVPERAVAIRTTRPTGRKAAGAAARYHEAPEAAGNRFGLTAQGVCDKESEMGTSRAENAQRNPSELQAARDRTISQALDLSWVTCRLL